MPLTPEELYLQLGSLVAEMPDLANGPITPEVNRWMGRACALVNQVDPFRIEFSSLIGTACQHLSGDLRETNAQSIASIVYQALARAELDAPARLQGKFITVGSHLDAYASVGRVLALAKTRVLMIDPFADINIVEYAMHAPSEVPVQVLADAKKHKDTLKPAVEKWARQFQGKRPPLEVRLAPVNTLHDRLIIVDGSVYDLGQSFNQLAKSAPTSFERSDGDTAREKMDWYLATWETATPL
jgi:hypothetical protein